MLMSIFSVLYIQAGRTCNYIASFFWKQQPQEQLLVTADMIWKAMIQKMRPRKCLSTQADVRLPGCVQCCRVSNGDHLSRKRRASRGRIAWLSPLPCLPVYPALDSPSLHQTGPSEQPPGGFLREKTEGRLAYAELVDWSMFGKSRYRGNSRLSPLNQKSRKLTLCFYHEQSTALSPTSMKCGE